MSYNPNQDDAEQPEYQWFEDFMDGMIAIFVGLVSLFFGIIVSCITSLFSSKDTDPPEESE